MEFLHNALLNNLLGLLVFFLLILSVASLWIRKTVWLWGSLFILSYLLAFQTKIATPLSIIPVLLLAAGHWTLSRQVTGPSRFILVSLITLLSFALWMHLVPGFHNWELLHKVRLSPDAVPYSLWLNFDKPLTGLFPLAFAIPLITTKGSLKKWAKIAIPLSILGVIIMIALSLSTDIVKWDPKLPPFTLVWLIENLLLVSLIEEAFLRGFLQRELCTAFGGVGWKANVGAVVATALIFALLHIAFVNTISFLCLAFVAGLIYGGIYQYTKAIESSIFCHFLLNVTHLFLFTYPAVAHA